MRMLGCLLLLPLLLAAQRAELSRAEVVAKHAQHCANRHIGKNIVKETQAGRDVNEEVDVNVLVAQAETEDVAPYPAHHLRSVACGADAILLVDSAQKISSNLSATDDFVFTDYTFHVLSVIKENDPLNLEPGSTIIVTRPGGSMVLNHRSVRVAMDRFPQFDDLEQYVMFLKYLPDSKSYEAFRNGTYPLSSSSTENSRYSADPKGAFLHEVEDASKTSCKNITSDLN